MPLQALLFNNIFVFPSSDCPPHEQYYIEQLKTSEMFTSLRVDASYCVMMMMYSSSQLHGHPLYYFTLTNGGRR